MGDDLIGAQPPEPVKKVRADAMARAERAWNARVLGASWEQAATIAGYSDASNAIRAVRSVYGSLPAIERDEARRLWRDRLEVIYRQVLKDVHDRIPGATTAAVRIADRAARLDGLDEPARLSITPSDGELQRFVSTVIAAQGGRDIPDEGDIFGDVVDAEIVEDDEPA
jgi:hypothetical protein